MREFITNRAGQLLLMIVFTNLTLVSVQLALKPALFTSAKLFKLPTEEKQWFYAEKVPSILATVKHSLNCTLNALDIEVISAGDRNEALPACFSDQYD